MLWSDVCAIGKVEKKKNAGLSSVIYISFATCLENLFSVLLIRDK